jgi:ankyrin repeat protein
MMACSRGHVNVVEKLLSLGDSNRIDLNMKNEEGQTALMIAYREGHLNVVEKLLSVAESNQIDLNMKNQDGDTALMMACREGHVNIVEKLLSLAESNQIDLNIKNQDSNTSFIIACQNGMLNIVRELLKHKDYIHTKSDNFFGEDLSLLSKLYEDFYRNYMFRPFIDPQTRFDIIQEVLKIEYKDFIKDKPESDGMTLFDRVWMNKDFVVLNLLLNAGIEISALSIEQMIELHLTDFPDLEKKSMLINALSRGSDRFAQMLIQQLPAELFSSDDAQSLLLLAIMDCSLATFDSLLVKVSPENLNTVDHEGKTLLHHAVSQGDKEKVGFLLNKGISTLIKDVYQRTAIDYLNDITDNKVKKEIEAEFFIHSRSSSLLFIHKKGPVDDQDRNNKGCSIS